jgi:hypothetical protein
VVQEHARATATPGQRAETSQTVFVCAHKARLPIIASDAMLKNRNEMATALINRECTFVTAL